MTPINDSSATAKRGRASLALALMVAITACEDTGTAPELDVGAPDSALLTSAQSTQSGCARNDHIRTGVGTPATIDPGINDQCGYHSLFYRVVTRPKHGQVSGGYERSIYTPDPGFEGIDSFTYELLSYGIVVGGPHVAVVTIEVTKDFAQIGILQPPTGPRKPIRRIFLPF